MPMPMGGVATTLAANVLRHSASGTSLEPGTIEPPMLMSMKQKWMLMVHGEAFLVEQQQSGARGHDKFFAVNWFMPMAQRSFGRSQLTLRSMLSLEPATITGQYYPELFQQGETAYGRPIVDGQHPHNLFMEIAGIYDFKLAEKALLTVYAAPVGDPAIGPVAYPHRASASEDPLATLGHHLEDSTHISYDVITAGVSAGGAHGAHLEGSGFHGREPDENRWHMQAGPIDSWDGRLTIVPGRNWLGQYSVGRLHSPEAVHPEEDILRQTASIAAHFGKHNTLDAGAVWGRNHTVGAAQNWNAYLLEATLHMRSKHALWTRMENADRTSDLLGNAAPEAEYVVGRVQAYTGGYAYSLHSWSFGAVELGAQFTTYTTPSSLMQHYGQHPWGVAPFLKLQLGK
ncbi:MAG TPA: hypothetical protein VGL22_03790 [Terracidiphilus sp.]